MTYQLPASTKIGAVALTITDLSRSVAYYEQLGLKVHHQSDDAAWLGVGDDDLLILYQDRNAKAIQRTAGLYHFAILLPSRIDLALAFKNMIDQRIPVGGYSDHLVSEAIYLSDPDGNGIEVYQDRPRKGWAYRANGDLQIETHPLDLQSLLSELDAVNLQWQGFPKGTSVGHIHLHVGNLIETGRFYNEVLGFDLIAQYGRSAQFLSAGGYHHHIGMNTWAGEGVPPAPDDSVGLCWFSIVLPTNKDRAALIAHLNSVNIPYEQKEDGFLLKDPSGSSLFIRS